MSRAKLASVALVVRDYEEAINFYVQKLGFVLVEDTQLSDTKRWVLVKPSEASECAILLAKADGDEQSQLIGNQGGGRVWLFIHTDNFQRDFDRLQANSVEIVRGPIVQPYGTVAVFKDLYGNQWDLIQRTDAK